MRINCLASEITQAFEYIEDHLEERISLDDLSAVCSLSKYHLHRILSAIANRPVMDYVRARKLCEGVQKLNDTRYRVIDIAVEYSFSYEQSYIRTFKKEFGITPGAFRVHPIPLEVTEKICPLHYSSISDGLLISPIFRIEKELAFASKEINLDPLRNRWDSPDQMSFYEPFCQWQHSSIYPHPEQFIGLTCWEDTKRQTAAYYACREVVSADMVPEGFSTRTLNACQYAVFKYIGLFHAHDLNQSHLDELWEYIHYAWMPKSQYRLSRPYHFICLDDRRTRTHYCEASLYVPVVERHEADIK